MAKKPYSPVASYEQLRDVEKKLSLATSVDEVRKLVLSDGPKVGYKAFCYILGGRMTAAAMKPDEACAAASGLEQAGQVDAALTIYKAVLAVHEEHPIAAARAQALE